MFATSLALQAAFLLRHEFKIYHIYSAPLTILDAAIVLARYRWILSTRAGLIAVVLAMGCYGIAGFAKAVSLSKTPLEPAAVSCVWHSAYLKRLEPFPFCRTEPDCAVTFRQ